MRNNPVLCVKKVCKKCGVSDLPSSVWSAIVEKEAKEKKKTKENAVISALA